MEAGSAVGMHVVIPPITYCTDNAAMIGIAALNGPRVDYPHYVALDASASLALGQWGLPGGCERPGSFARD